MLEISNTTPLPARVYANEGISQFLFLKGDTVTALQRQVTEIEHREAIRDHTKGVAFDPDKLERLARYETHLDRKMERTVGQRQMIGRGTHLGEPP